MGRESLEKQAELNDRYGSGRINVLRKFMHGANLKREEVFLLSDLLRLERENDRDILARESQFLAEELTIEDYELLEYMSAEETSDNPTYTFPLGQEEGEPLRERGYLELSPNSEYALLDKARLLFPQNY